MNRSSSSTRKLSASFTDGPPSGQPSVATSSLTVSSNVPSSYTTKETEIPGSGWPQCRRVTPTTLVIPTASTAMTTYANAEIAPHGPNNDENLAPRSLVGGLAHKHKNSIDIVAAKLRNKTMKPRPLGAIPRSNTLNAFSGISSSLSRGSLVKTRSTSNKSTNEIVESGPTSASRPVALPSAEENNPRQVHTAQPSAYWTGRFMALQDRLLNELLTPDNITTLVTAHAERGVLANGGVHSSIILPAQAHQGQASVLKRNYRSPNFDVISSSTVESGYAEMSLDATRLQDEENRARQVFLYLEALCTTGEARESLHEWQQVYARRTGKDGLLPRGKRSERKGWMGRLLRRSGIQNGSKWGSTGNIA
ncbi:hypothetical protein BX600DRAFT_435852 [Xylariales sp. PMI_506]|nr:hypothetical protein BX600DRAFT_435852 [Xylariales sp. PMI_506]